MEKEREMLERITVLEEELAALRTEVHALKSEAVPAKTAVRIKPAAVKTPAPKAVQPEKTAAVTNAANIDVAEQAHKIPLPEETIAPKKKRSLEETFTRALPRIFTVILVLGVLWGLKLVSDYGFLSDSLKIIAGFALSVGLAAFALVMEKKQKGSIVVALSLYGGGFIVGILTTAAGAILYDVLSLTAALVLALLYIGYGVWISYVKGNEALTVLVVFTSLLLPYLLEYMDFNPVIIGLFILVLFAAVQTVIVKHAQRKALYIGTIFSIGAVVIVSLFHNEKLVFFAAATVILYTLFIGSYLRIYPRESKFNVSIVFSYTMAVLAILNGMLWQKEGMLFVLLIVVAGVLAGALYITFMRKDQLRIDLFATLISLVVINIVARLNIAHEVTMLLLVIVAFAGFTLALKHTILFMKWIQGLTFSFLVLYVISFYDVLPLLSMRHFVLLLVLAMLAALYVLLRRFTLQAALEEGRAFLVKDVYPCILYSAALLYIWKLDAAYMPVHLTSYLLIGAIAAGFGAVLLIKLQHIGHFIPVLALILYGLAGLSLLTDVWIPQRAVSAALLLRILYLVILWAVAADLWQQGKIYRNYKAFVAPHTERIVMAVLVVTIAWCFAVTHFMNDHMLISWNTAVICNTLCIFFVACVSLFLAAKRSYHKLKLVGIGLLFFGIIKMIFFDLSELDILIRSISFILIGAIGLVISNKLLGKGKKES